MTEGAEMTWRRDGYGSVDHEWGWPLGGWGYGPARWLGGGGASYEPEAISGPESGGKADGLGGEADGGGLDMEERT